MIVKFLAAYSLLATVVIGWLLFQPESKPVKARPASPAEAPANTAAKPENRQTPQNPYEHPTDPEEQAKTRKTYAWYELCRKDGREAWRRLMSGEAEMDEARAWQFAAGHLVALEGIKAVEEIFQTTGPQSGEAKTAAIMTLANIDPPAFLAFYQKNPLVLTGGLARQIAMLMAGKDIETAFAWANAIPEKTMAAYALPGMFSNWLAKDPEKATAWLNENHRNMAADDMIWSVIHSTRETDPVAALRWAEQLSEKAGRSMEMESSLLSLSETNREEAAAWIDQSGAAEVEKNRLRRLIEKGGLRQQGGVISTYKSGVVTFNK